VVLLISSLSLFSQNKSVSPDDIWTAINNLEELDFMDVSIMEQLHEKKQKTYYRRGDHSITGDAHTLNPAFYTAATKEQNTTATSIWLNDCFYT